MIVRVKLVNLPVVAEIFGYMPEILPPPASQQGCPDPACCGAPTSEDLAAKGLVGVELPPGMNGRQFTDLMASRGLGRKAREAK